MTTRTSSTARTTTTTTTKARRRTGILAGLLAVGFGAGLLAPTIASAAPAESTTHSVATQGGAWYTSALLIDNHSSYTMVQKAESTWINDIKGKASWEAGAGTPVNGTTIAPDESKHYELKLVHPQITSGTITYGIQDADGTSHGDLTATLRLDTGFFSSDAYVSCTTNVPEVGCVAYNRETVAFFDNE